jgi:hypothetical protein
MNARLFQAKSHGQSIPIIALILVVLFAMVGLSVDVGNTYAQNRNAVRSTNAAVLAGMDRLIRDGEQASDVSIGKAIQASFKSNGITAQIDPTVALGAGERRISAYYLDSSGNPLGESCTIGKCGGVPKDVAYIQVKTEGTVDTYFARVVGQPTLPVKAQAFAGQCTPVKGVYPIAVNLANIDSTKGIFYPPTGPNAEAEIKYYGMYYDENYDTGRTQRRIYRKADFSQPGNFDWLKWPSDKNAGNAGATEDMMSLDGNLDLGFDEVVMDPPIKSSTGKQYTTGWPDPNSAEVTGYPLFPHQLSEGDWIYGNTGNDGASGVKDALDYHIANRTVLNLPIVDRVIGSGGANSYFHFVKMGAFLLRGYDLTANGYFDLVYVGGANKTACLSENISQGAKGLGLSGQVYVNPRWQQPLGANQPIAYNIVLDLSGSMSWDFNGYGTYGGNSVQCESPNNPGSSFPYINECDGGGNSAWKTKSERRVYVAKNAIFKFINNMRQYDMMRVVGFSGDMTGNANPSAEWVVTSDQAAKDALITTVKNMGALGGDPYKTSGGTPGPDALATAATMFQSSAGYTPIAGNSEKFRPVVIYFTDGVANVFQSSGVGKDDGAINDARDICSDMSVAEARNTADPCQLGTTASGKARPIAAMINIANSMKANNPELAIYTIGLGPVPATGLPRVATEPDNYFSASKGDYVQDILDTIQAQVTGATCASTGGYSWLNTIDSVNAPTGSPFNTLGSGVYGQVFIYEVGAGTPKYTLPIELDQSITVDGRLGYSIVGGVTPGNYEMEAYVGYRGEDGVTRSYDWFIDPSSLNEAHRITVSVTSASTLGGSVPLPPIFMDLRSTVSVCPAGP